MAKRKAAEGRPANEGGAKPGAGKGGGFKKKKQRTNDNKKKEPVEENPQPAGVNGADAATLVPVTNAGKDGEGNEGEAAGFRNKEKVLILCTRGTGARFRHLMLDLVQLLPHCKKDSKLDTKNERMVINEVAELKGCSSVLFFETRKKKDLYVWAAKTPEGPTVKFLAQNIHTMSELRLTGNHLKGARPVLSFDKQFDESPQWRLIKELFKQIFVTPHRHHKSKPFFDHVINFGLVDGRVWIRNYQVSYQYHKTKVNVEDTQLVEVGPRVCLLPIKLFEGGFRGKGLFHNPEYVSPNSIRSALKRRAAEKRKDKFEVDQKKKARKPKLPRDETAHAFE
ncbi:hypothetical protein BSKO_08354 [Bryopsis sp. KO-2023]|nr:hypothetical protein BSKO_08354 [Bryopsis sp. KO-2023]